MPAFVAVCDLLHRRGLDGATALLGVDGTAHGRRERAAFFSRNAEVPMMVIAVGAGDRIGQVLPELGALLRRPLLTLERVRVASGTAGSWPRPPRCRPPTSTAWRCGTSSWSTPPRRPGTAASRSTAPSSGGCARPGSAGPPPCAASGVSTATTRRTATGCCNWAATSPPSRSSSTRPERIATAFAIIDELTSERGLVTSETIPALRAAAGDRRRGGPRLATHHLSGGASRTGGPA